MDVRRYRVVFRREARDEAIAAAMYIVEQGKLETAVRWYGALELAVQSLSTMPHRCELAREDSLFPGVELRQLVFKTYRIIFTIEVDEVHVLHVRHSSRLGLDL